MYTSTGKKIEFVQASNENIDKIRTVGKINASIIFYAGPDKGRRRFFFSIRNWERWELNWFHLVPKTKGIQAIRPLFRSGPFGYNGPRVV